MVSAGGSLGIFEPVFEHLSNVVGGSFTVLLAPAFTTEDKFREAQERMSLFEVTPVRGILSGTQEKRTSSRFGVSGVNGGDLRVDLHNRRYDRNPFGDLSTLL